VSESGVAMDWAALVALGEFVMHEAALFAAVGFLFLGVSDLAVDLIWIGLRLRQAWRHLRYGQGSVASLPPPERPGRLAIFIPAWDEAAVIGRMLEHTLSAFGESGFRLYVGCYPNDPATIAAVRAVGDPRVRLVVGPVPGSTSKADCLNRLWEAMKADEARECRRFKAVILHDAEDVVHSAELRLFDALIERFDLIQLPVLPLIDRSSPWVAGHYADEFAESHGKEMVVREALGASLPSAGVGCAISRDALETLAARHGAPFDPGSLTEDYELGLRLHAMGRRAAFVRLPPERGKAVVSTREYFPATMDAAVAQKARWMVGIALAGWDRLGWRGGLGERWMRMRDRQSVLAAFILAAAYFAAFVWVPLLLAERFVELELRPFPPLLSWLVAANLLLLAWRLGMRFGFAAQAYGWRQGLLSIPRTIVGNIVAMAAVRRAVMRYLRIRRTGALHWDKTRHAFPAQLPAE
jgi:bacteriophage N4 adsorption protein B